MGGYTLAFWDDDVKIRYRKFRATPKNDSGLRDLVLTVLSNPKPDYEVKYPVPPPGPNLTPFDISTIATGDYFAVRQVDGVTYQFLYFEDRGRAKRVVMTDVDVI